MGEAPGTEETGNGDLDELDEDMGACSLCGGAGRPLGRGGTDGGNGRVEERGVELLEEDSAGVLPPANGK
jgi:hypothetical protein